VQADEREQAERLGLLRQQARHQADQPRGVPGEVVARRRPVAPGVIGHLFWFSGTFGDA